MTTADFNVLTKLCNFMSKIYEKVCPSKSMSQFTCSLYILYIFVHIVYSTSYTIKWFK